MAVDKDEKRILTKDEIKNGVPGGAGNLNFFRNLNSGVVNLATHGDAKDSGWYDYAANAVKEPVARQYRGGTIQVPSWVSIGDSLKYKDQFTEATPFGKSKISAEGGASVLKKLGDGSKLASAAPGKCVTGVLDTMAANGVPIQQELVVTVTILEVLLLN